MALTMVTVAAVTQFNSSFIWSVLYLILSVYLYSALNSPLKTFPGPVLAANTNFWRIWDVYRGRTGETHLKLHRKHGSVVRIGPNVLSLSDPNMINRVYNAKSPWNKSDFYAVNDVKVGGMRVSTLFSSRDEKWHAAALRPVRALYSMTQVLELEHLMDNIIDLLCKKLDTRFVKSGASCDIANYVLYAAWDAMGEVTFSKTLGMLDAGYDHNNLIEDSKTSIDYFACISQIPILDYFLGKNPLFESFGSSWMLWAVELIQGIYQKRIQEEEEPQSPSVKTPDFMDRVIQAQRKYPDIIHEGMVNNYLLGNVVAGSDTTATTISAAIYYVLKNPTVHAKLRDELSAADLSLPAKWKDLQKLPYFTAVMREARRIHPGVGMLLERVVPAGGLDLPDGQFVPEGTIVGMNPWVVNRDRDVFGPDSDLFVPERWLQSPSESEECFQARLGRMQRTILTFGAGSRTCIGKNLSEMESDKMVATLFAKYEMQLVDPTSAWTFEQLWFVRQENISVTMKHRPADIRV